MRIRNLLILHGYHPLAQYKNPDCNFFWGGGRYPLMEPEIKRLCSQFKRITISTQEMDKAKNLAKQLFGAISPDGQDKLIRFIKEKLAGWQNDLSTCQTLADTGRYPGKNEIDACLSVIQKIASIRDSFEVITAFNTLKNDLLDLVDDWSDLTDFYTHQRKTWEDLLNANDKFKPNRFVLEKNAESGAALKRMNEILTAPNPYKMLKEANGLIAAITRVNEALVKARQENAIGEVDIKISLLSDLLKDKKADPDFQNKTLRPIQEVKKFILNEYSMPQVTEYVNESVALYESALIEIEEKFKFKPDPEPVKPGGKKPVTSSPTPPKPIKAIRAADFRKKAYIETEADVDVFVNALRKNLLEVIKNNYKISLT